MDYQNNSGAACGAICTNDAEVRVFPSLAMVYIPMQKFREVYDYDIGLSRGTIFRELDKPFTMRRSQQSGCCMNKTNGSDRKR